MRCTKAEANNTQCHTRQHLLCSSELCYHACQWCFNCLQRTSPLKVTYAKHVHPTRNKYYEWLHPRCVPTFPHACTEANFYVKPTQKQCPRQNRVMTCTAKNCGDKRRAPIFHPLFTQVTAKAEVYISCAPSQ